MIGEVDFALFILSFLQNKKHVFSLKVNNSFFILTRYCTPLDRFWDHLVGADELLQALMSHEGSRAYFDNLISPMAVELN